MPKIVDVDSQKREIREAARRVFARRGVRGTGLEHVAAAAKMGRSSLYHYYSSKDALLADLVRDLLRQERALFRACLRGKGAPLERLDRLARACAQLFPEWSAFGRMILDLRLDDAKYLKTYFRELRRDLASVIAEGQEDGSLSPEPAAELSASILIGAIDGLLLQYFVDERALPRPEELAEALCQTIRKMVVA